MGYKPRALIRLYKIWLFQCKLRATRIVTINHEWVPIILSTVESYNSGRLDYYYKKYQNELIWGTMTNDGIIALAKADSDAYAVTYRNNLIKSCKDNKDVFNKTF